MYVYVIANMCVRVYNYKSISVYNHKYIRYSQNGKCLEPFALTTRDLVLLFCS